MRTVEVTSAATAESLAFDRSQPCLFTFPHNNLMKPESASGSASASSTTHTITPSTAVTSVESLVSSIISSFNTLPAVKDLIGGDNINNIRIYDSDHNITSCKDMTFDEYMDIVSSGEASEKDMYWAYGQELLSLKLEEFFCCIENILGFSRSPPLTGWVGSRHTEQLHYDDEDNLHLIIHGHKRWHIFPPNAPLQYPSLHTLFGSSSGHIIQSDPCTSPLQAETQSQLTPIVITLSPGDLLYVPAAWSHEVQSVPDSPTSLVCIQYQ